MSELKPLTEQLEQRIRESVTRKIADALGIGHRAALAAYAQAMQPICDAPLVPIIADALSDADVRIAEFAQRLCEASEFDKVLQKLTETAETPA